MIFWHNGEEFCEIPESFLDKISSIIDTGLINNACLPTYVYIMTCFDVRLMHAIYNHLQIHVGILYTLSLYLQDIFILGVLTGLIVALVAMYGYGKIILTGTTGAKCTSHSSACYQS